MKILENSEVNYSVDDIIEAIEDQLGFSLVRVSDSTYYIVLGSDLRLIIDFLGEVDISLKLPSKVVNMSDKTSEVEALISAAESSIEVVDIIKRMTGGSVDEEDIT